MNPTTIMTAIEDHLRRKGTMDIIDYAKIMQRVCEQEMKELKKDAEKEGKRWRQNSDKQKKYNQ